MQHLTAFKIYTENCSDIPQQKVYWHGARFSLLIPTKVSMKSIDKLTKIRGTSELGVLEVEKS